MFSLKTMLLYGILLLVVLMCLIDFVVISDENTSGKSTNAKTKKLQIGVKKRPEVCDKKSKKGDVLHMHYKGTLEDGTEFDTSYKRGEPLSFTLGSGQVIRGWDQGLLGMCEGEKRKLVIPPDLGYGSAGAPPTIPGDAVLTFEVELVKIERKSEL
ncbi:peptidyl-prolyl cis-trans isomerase FKBP2-like [Centruroides vittatus]|uniref:peptidyl-prolyl cis-trans isomerase FKBP2-like n=1 Tax=Centruroides vittatus TaxID=120091 RepID=UPI003510538D